MARSSQLPLTFVGESPLQEDSLAGRMLQLLCSQEEGRQKQFEPCEKARETTAGKIIDITEEYQRRALGAMTRKEIEAACPEGPPGARGHVGFLEPA